MTCIAAVVHQDIIHMGADSYIGTQQHHWKLSSNESKIAKLSISVKDKPTEYMLWGIAGCFRGIQVLKHLVELPPYDPSTGENELQFLVKRVVPAVRNALQEHFPESQAPDAELFNWILIGWRKQLYYVDPRWGINPVATSFLAVGSGGSTAMGSLHTSAGILTDPHTRLLAALTAAEDTTDFVRGPFYFDTDRPAPLTSRRCKPSR